MTDLMSWTMADKLGRDVAVGDVLVFLGDPHMITRIMPYSGSNTYLWEADGGARVAYSGPDWDITLDPAGRYEVVQPEGGE
jgi:hypothetical protein